MEVGFWPLPLAPPSPLPGLLPLLPAASSTPAGALPGAFSANTCAVPLSLDTASQAQSLEKARL